MASENSALRGRAAPENGHYLKSLQRAQSLLNSVPDDYRQAALDMFSYLLDEISAVPENEAKETFSRLLEPGMTDSERFFRLAAITYRHRNREPTFEESLARSHVRALQALDALMAVTGGSLGKTETQTLLGITRQALEKRMARNTILWAKVGREARFPAAQFDKDTGKVHALVRDMLGELKHAESNVSRLSFFLTPKKALDGERPITLLASGQVTKAQIDEIRRRARLHLTHGGL